MRSEADLVEARRPGPLDDRRHAQRVVRAVQRAQDVRDRGLHPERDPRDPTGAQLLEVTRVTAVRVRLGGDLGARRRDRTPRTPPRPRRSGRPARAGSAYRRRRRSTRPGTSRSPSTRRARRISRDGRLGVRRPRRPGRGRRAAQLIGGVGVEVAVAAAHGAERHVHVDPERAVRPTRRARRTGGSRPPVPAHRRAGRRASPHPITRTARRSSPGGSSRPRCA